MTATQYSHVGIVVNNLEAAIDHFSSFTGLHFNDPRTIAVDVEEVGKRSIREITFSYSSEGPPYVELLEAQPDGLWGKQQGEGLHHIGIYEPGMEATVESLLTQGHQPAARIRDSDGKLLAVYLEATHEHVHGTRLEFLHPR